jgi:hypothetical protein
MEGSDMTYIKKSERFIKAANFTKPIKDNGGTVREAGEYSKWKHIDEYRKVQVSFTILAMSANGNTAYILKDNMGMVASYPTQDINELKSFLAEKGFKPIKDWYIQDCGMSEETWKEWNTSND